MSDRCPVCGRMVGPDEPCFHPPAPEQPINTLARLVMGAAAGWVIAMVVVPVLLLSLFLPKAALLLFGVPALMFWVLHQLLKAGDRRRQRRREEYQKRVSTRRTPPPDPELRSDWGSR